MQKIDYTSARGGEISSNRFKPNAVSAICPYCNEKVVFTCSGHSDTGPINSVSATGICPNCQKHVGIWTVTPSDKAGRGATEIFMYPPAKVRFPHPAESESLPQDLRRALIAAIDAYNAGIYTATAVAARRTLEGIFKHLAPADDGRKSLHVLIELAKENPALAEPLTNLSHLVRTGGNLGAHFDAQREPNEALARQMVELVDYLFSYLYVLPTKIKELEAELLRIDFP